MLALAGCLSMPIRTFVTHIGREYISDDYWRNTVVVDTGDVSPVEFALSIGQKQGLYQRGLQTTRQVTPLKLENAVAELAATAI